mmetsp:Transcript_18918/g.40546  ORF Transcript_18918/g.40546 Transcript_18918/m.40546 type:complete len:95 (+) Transcript_18918:179-463(+)
MHNVKNWEVDLAVEALQMETCKKGSKDSGSSKDSRGGKDAAESKVRKGNGKGSGGSKGESATLKLSRTNSKENEESEGGEDWKNVATRGRRYPP